MPSSKPLKILIVEDERIAATVLSKMLERLGYMADIAENGQTALSLVANGYDLIFMDIGLPDMDGISVSAEIRKREEGSTYRAHIVAVTAYLLEDVEARGLAAGIDEVIVKPMPAEKLSKIVETALGNKQEL